MTAARSTALFAGAVALVSLGAGAAAGWHLRGRGAPAPPRPAPSQSREGGWRFVNPLLECDPGGELAESEALAPFRAKVEAEVRRLGPAVERVSLYFRELNDGIWFAIGDVERFAPASLRKVPTMITVLKMAERDPGLLDRALPFRLTRDYNEAQTFKPAVTMTPGAEYAIAELIRRMIVYSDNNAFMLLNAHLDPAELDRTYQVLDLRAPISGPGSDAYQSVVTFASYFRILYNASYLRKDLSEWALATLSRTAFRSGIVAGVPPGLPVAHKFGEHRDDAAGAVQLHDCGIVYHPRTPYLLCVMTRGRAFPPLDDAIASISRAVYEEVDRQTPVR